MRCERARKRLSDEFDGASTASRQARVETHLRDCPACRTYREDLVLLQENARTGADRSPEYWAGFEARLAAKLDSATAGHRSAGLSGRPRQRLAWAAAGLLVLAVAGAYFGFLRKESGTGEAVWFAYEDGLGPLIQEAEADVEFGRIVEREVLASIGELVPEAEAEAMNPADDPLFWEGLSDAELETIAAALSNETGLGGPK